MPNSSLPFPPEHENRIDLHELCRATSLRYALIQSEKNVLVASRILTYLALACLALASPAYARHDQPASATFSECKDARAHTTLQRTECARIDVPLDYTKPDLETIQLFVRKFPAQRARKGQLWLVAGGPGESGASFYPFIETFRAAAPGFDLMIPDHRGTGFSTRLCPEEESPSSDAGTALAGEEWATCFDDLNANAGRTRSFTISNAAHDLKLLMSRFDSGDSSYLYGVSYGTQLVLRMLTLAPRGDLDGVILDSLVPLESNDQLDLSHRSAVTDRVGRKVLRQCDQVADCKRYFPEGAEQAVTELFQRDDIGDLAGQDLKYRLSALLDFPETRDMLPNVIAGLQADNPAWLDYAMGRLAGIGSVLKSYPQSGSSIPLVNLISRSENNARPQLTAEMIRNETEGYLFASPLPSLLLAGGIPTYQPDASFGGIPERIPPTIVLHGTLDPKTPLDGAREHVTALKVAGDISLLQIEQAPHFVLMTAPEEFKELTKSFLGRADGRRSSP
ncbi:alpha/beta fold hydrolase [Novosphingobium sp. BW1]|uniref:alpha/beta fold hydrolase n=1 Tax=Novosphingobium sp. BW1 TaxID=2592621 RepID=UPI0011DE6529|nr:alpha/beta hydrolase [Novosphingobium sp. BW1]TYC97419.1 alpha/beta hydrolase [Novosphingobium sp. BW1]